MLSYLRITDFALLDDVEISLGPGMTVLTGETGAGKSLVIDAVSLLRGGRASADMVRSGAEEARVEAVFAPTPGSVAEQGLRERLERCGIESARLSEEGLIVRRVIGRSGRGRVYLMGQLATVGALAEVCGGLVDIAGQHEHQTLMDVTQHLRVLDRCGVDAPLLSRMNEAFEQLRVAGEALKAASLDERTRAEREEFLRFQLKELNDADLQVGEDEALRKERDRLRAAERLHRAARRGEECLYSREGSLVDELGGLVRELGELGTIDPQLGALAQQLGDAQAVLEDAAGSLRRYADHQVADPERLAGVEDRLHLLAKILRKHGPDLRSALRRHEEMAAELTSLVSHEERRAQAQHHVNQARAQASAAASALSAARRTAAERVGQQVTEALRELCMKGARLEAHLEPRAPREGDEAVYLFGGDGKDLPPRRLTREGWDRCELLLAPNPGAEPRPLQRIASGGELSRVMLALKRILGQADGVATYIFDEVDTGIGGAAANQVGRQIRVLAESKQVLCITHLAPIAAFADDHLLVEKRFEDGRTRTLIRRLPVPERREEVARMLGGPRITQRTRAHAEELLRETKLGA